MSEDKNIKIAKLIGLEKKTREAKTEDEAVELYYRGHYKYSNYDLDDMFYDYQFVEIREETD